MIATNQARWSVKMELLSQHGTMQINLSSACHIVSKHYKMNKLLKVPNNSKEKVQQPNYQKTRSNLRIQ